MIRVLLADDEELIRTALAALLDLEEDLSVVAQAADGEAAVTAALAHRPDVAVIDLTMPRRDGFQVATELPGRYRRVRWSSSPARAGRRT